MYCVRSVSKTSFAIPRVHDGGVSKPSIGGRQKRSAAPAANIPWVAIIPHIDAISRKVAPGVGWVDMFRDNASTDHRVAVMKELNAHTSVPLKLMRSVMNKKGEATMSDRWFRANAIVKLAQSCTGTQ